jgi:ABC-type transport system involved in multi-copper enzyme maturation permease subunit
VLALTISVWALRTHEALMAVYAFWTLALLAYPIWEMMVLAGTGIIGPPRWLLKLNPVWLSFSPYLAPNQVDWTDFAVFVVGALGLSAALALLAVARLRPVTIHVTSRPSGTRQPKARLSLVGRLTRVLPGPSLDGNPVLWREWHSNQPSRITRLIGWGYAGGITFGGVAALYSIFWYGATRGNAAGLFVILLGIGLGLLLLSVTAATTLAEERVRGSLDVLLATPLRTRAILWGKWWGAFRIVPVVAFWPTMIIAALAISRGRPPAPGTVVPRPEDPVLVVWAVGLIALVVLIHGAAITSLGLALATWIPRQGRAVGLCVAAYVLVAIGWIVVIVSLTRGPTLFVESLLSLSPVFAGGQLWEALQPPRYRRLPESLAAITAWLVLVGGFSILCKVLTYATFDRCLGRTPDWRDEGRLDLNASRRQA